MLEPDDDFNMGSQRITVCSGRQLTESPYRSRFFTLPDKDTKAQEYESYGL